MAIPPGGGFSVPSIDPSILYARKPPRPRSPIDDIMQTAISNIFESQARRESEAYGRETSTMLEDKAEKNAAVQTFTNMLAKGELESVPADAPDYYGSLERINAPAGFDAQGRQFVRGSDVRMKRPFTQYAGRDVKPGTTFEDVTDPATGQVNPALAAGVAAGDVKTIEALVASIPTGAGPTVKRAGQAMLDAAKRDPFFSYAEQEDMMKDGLDLRSMDQYQDSVRSYQELQSQDQARVGQAMLEIAGRWQVLRQTPGGGPPMRDVLSPVERLALARKTAGVSTTPAEDKIVDQLYGGSGSPIRLVPSHDIFGQFDAIHGEFVKAGNGSTVENQDFQTFVAPFLWGQPGTKDEGKIVNTEVAKDITSSGVGTDITPDAVKAWSTTANAAAYRAAYALFQNGIQKRSTAQGMAAQGFDWPFSLDAAMDAAGKLMPGFNDIAPRSRGGVPEGATEADLTKHYTAVQLDGRQKQLRAYIEHADPDMLKAAGRIMQTGAPRQIADSLRATARDIRTNGKRLKDTSAEDWAKQFETWADYAEQDPNKFSVFRDSVFLPTINGISQR